MREVPGALWERLAQIRQFSSWTRAAPARSQLPGRGGGRGPGGRHDQETLDVTQLGGVPACRQSAWRDCDDHVALLVAKVDVAVCLDNLIQLVTAVDHRPKRAALGEFLQHQQV